MKSPGEYFIEVFEKGDYMLPLDHSDYMRFAEDYTNYVINHEKTYVDSTKT